LVKLCFKIGLGSCFWTIKHFKNKGGAKILYFEKKARGMSEGMITRTQGLCLSTNLFTNPHSCKQYFHNNLGKHTGNPILITLLQKVFVGPHFFALPNSA
jgi:hypothetical protein